jgi:hypothetical protein
MGTHDILSAIVGAIISGVIGWTARRVVNAAKDVSRAAKQIERIVNILGEPEAGDRQIPLVPYLHDTMHRLDNSVTKIMLSTSILNRASKKIDEQT